MVPTSLSAVKAVDSMEGSAPRTVSQTGEAPVRAKPQEQRISMRGGTRGTLAQGCAKLARRRAISFNSHSDLPVEVAQRNFPVAPLRVVRIGSR